MLLIQISSIHNYSIHIFLVCVLFGVVLVTFVFLLVWRPTDPTDRNWFNSKFKQTKSLFLCYFTCRVSISQFLNLEINVNVFGYFIYGWFNLSLESVSISTCFWFTTRLTKWYFLKSFLLNSLDFEKGFCIFKLKLKV